MKFLENITQETLKWYKTKINKNLAEINKANIFITSNDLKWFKMI
jgi:hypothetical protein